MNNIFSIVLPSVVDLTGDRLKPDPTSATPGKLEVLLFSYTVDDLNIAFLTGPLQRYIDVKLHTSLYHTYIRCALSDCTLCCLWDDSNYVSFSHFALYLVFLKK